MWIEQLTRPEHGVHDNCQFACQSHGRSLETEALFKLQCPDHSQGTVIRRPVQDDRGRFVKQTTQLTVATARDMAVTQPAPLWFPRLQEKAARAEL